MKKIRKVTALLLCALLTMAIFASGSMFAKETFTVWGSFLTQGKESGAPVLPAKVTFLESGGKRYTAQVSENGQTGTYSASVPFGRYSVVIEKPGYLAFTVKDVQVNNCDFDIREAALLPGDLTGDGKINTKDLAVMMRGFSTDDSFAAIRALADFNEDGNLQIEDFAAIKPNLDNTKKLYDWTTVKKLQTDYRNDPMGIDYVTPEFNWVMESAKRGEKQTAYELGVATSYEKVINSDFDVWYSGKVESDMTHAYYGEVNGVGSVAAQPLAAKTEYYWTIISYDKDGDAIPASQIAKFETGLFGDFGTDNKWIEAAEPYYAITKGTVEINLTVTQTAFGVYFGVSEDGSEKHMWQVNLTAYSTPMLRYHYNENGSWKVISSIDISSIIPDGAAEIGKPITMKLEFDNGVIKSYINGVYVFDYTMTSANKNIGKIYAHQSGGELGVINNVIITDESGTVLTDGTVNTLAASLFRKQFTLSQPIENVAKARLYSTAAGNQIMYMNGSRASDDYMAPGKSQYTTLLYYQTYDVKDLMLDGDNTVAAEVGHGWYNAGAVGAAYGTNVGLKAKLVVTYNDGTEQIIDTDSSWKSTRDGRTFTDKYYIGQYVDARKKIDDWCVNNSTSPKWNTVTATDTFKTTSGYTMTSNFVGENMEPVRNTMVLHPVSVTNPFPNTFVYKFDQNLVGTSRITAEAPEGTEIVINYSEFLSGNNGKTINGASYNYHNGEDKYIFKGDAGGETVEFDLVYHGFQYLQIDGLSEALPFENIEGLVLTSDMEETGSLKTSNPKINRYIDNVMWSIRGNFVSTLTDCPTREKNTWTGDAQIFAAVASYYSNVFNHYRNFEVMTRDSQYGNGAISELVPSLTKPSETSVGATKSPSGWSDCVIVIPWEMYNQYGDITIIRDSYDAMKKWINYLVTEKIGTDESDPATYFVRKDGNYGDHLAYYNNIANKGYLCLEDRTTKEVWRETSYQEIGTAFSSYSCLLLSTMAEEIGETEDAAYYLDLHNKFATAWKTNFVEADGITCKSGSQTSYAMGIFYDMYTDEEKPAAAAKLAEVVENEDYKQTVGFIGMNILYPALGSNGQFDTAMKLMENESYPSLLNMVNNGATTIWETYGGGTMSRNHYVFGAPARWLYTDVLGIAHAYESGNEGYKHFELRPTYASYDTTSVTWANGSFDSTNGLIKSAWKLSDDRKNFTYNCTVPANTSATLSLPIENESAYITEGGKDIAESEGIVYIKTENGRKYYEITSGVYEFVVNN